MNTLVSTPLTPPSTISRKENIKPSPVRSPRHHQLSPFRAPRVLFAPKHSHYPHLPTAPPRRLPSSRLFGRPGRSILKKPSMSYNSPPPESEAREKSPELEEPLNHVTYIASYIQIIISSLGPSSLTLHDLIEAWTTLFNRLRGCFPCDLQEPSALEPFKEHLDSILQCLERDIRRSLVNPIQRTALEDADLVGDEEPSPKKGGLTETEVTYARDLYMLSSSSLRFLSLLTWVPQFYELIEHDRMQRLVGIVLTILNAPSLPTPNPRKTYTIAAAVLQVQRLPVRTLIPLIPNITSALQRGLDGDFGREGKKGATWESLGALQTFANSGHSEFHSMFLSLFPSLISNLMSPAQSLRYKAALSYGSLAAHASQTTIPELDEAVEDVGTELSLAVENAFRMGGMEGSWGAIVLGATVTIISWRIFHHRRWMKTFLACMDVGLNSKKENMGLKFISRILWSMLVRAWGDGHHSGQDGFGVNGEYGLVIRQAKLGANHRFVATTQPSLFHQPVGATAVSSFIGDGSDQESVGVGIQLVAAMLQHKTPSSMELLFRLLDGPASTEGAKEAEEFSWNPKHLTCTAFLDGRALCMSEQDVRNMPIAARNLISNHCARVQHVRPLDPEEIRTHWDDLIACWDIVMKEGLARSNIRISRTVQSLWEMLLSARFTIDSSLAERIALAHILATKLTSFLTSPVSTWAHPEMTGDYDDIYCRLAVTSSLFASAAHTFASPRLPSSFCLRLLRSLADLNINKSDPEAADVWKALVSRIIEYEALIPTSDVFNVIGTQVSEENNRWSEPTYSPVSAKNPWRSVWECAVSLLANENVPWENAIDLVKFVPVTEWKAQETLWISALDRVIELARASGSNVDVVLDKIAPNLPMGGISGPASMSMAIKLLSVAADEEQTSADPRSGESTNRFASLFSFICGLLREHTPDKIKAANPGTIPIALELIRSIEKYMSAAHRHLVLPRFTALSAGLCVWLRDKTEVLSDDQYNKYMAALYVTVLDRLRHIEASAATLTTLTPFLVSGFERIPPLLLCPRAFKSFWADVFKPITPELDTCGYQYPEDLKVVLQLCIHEGAPESFAVGLSAGFETYNETASENDNESVVPETPETSGKPVMEPSLSPFKDQNAPKQGPVSLSDRPPASALAPQFSPLIFVPASSSIPSSSDVLNDNSDVDVDAARFIDSSDLPGTSETDALHTKTGVDETKKEVSVNQSNTSGPENVPQAEVSSASSHEPRSSHPASDKLADEAESASTPLSDVLSIEELEDEESIEASLVPATPSVTRILAPSRSKRRRGAQAPDGKSRKRRKSIEAGAADDEPVQRNLASSFVRGPNSLLRSASNNSMASSSPVSSVATPRRTRQRSKSLSKLPPTASSSPSSSPRKRVEVEVLTMKEAKKRLAMAASPRLAPADRSSSGNTSSPASSPSKSSSTAVKRKRSATKSTEETEIEQETATPPLRRSKRRRSSTIKATPSSSRKSEPTYVFVANSSPFGVKRPPVDLPSDDSVVEGTPSVVDTPEIPLRGPSLPSDGQTILSPALRRVAKTKEEVPSSDDSAQSNTSPIHQHVARKLNRSSSSLASQSTSRPASIRAPSDELFRSVEQAFGSMTAVGALEGEQLLRLQAMVKGLSGKIDEAVISRQSSKSL